MIGSLTKPNYPSAALGIESNALSAVALQSNGKGRVAIRQGATVELPPGLLRPSFSSLNIADEVEFTGFLREVVESAGLLKQKRWSVALPSNAARTAILALDTEPASSKEAEEVLDWKAEQTFGVPAAELRLAKQKISPDSHGRSRYFATAVKLTVIDEYETLFESLGWRAGLILPRALGEANWLLGQSDVSDSLLISGNPDGFTALLLRGLEPAVVRSVICEPSEVSDEIYRLVMFYNDRFGASKGEGSLDRMMVIGHGLERDTVSSIASDALGHELGMISHEDVGLDIPTGSLTFNDIAAPAGLAALGV
jgi:hypothetical protein